MLKIKLKPQVVLEILLRYGKLVIWINLDISQPHLTQVTASIFSNFHIDVNKN